MRKFLVLFFSMVLFSSCQKDTPTSWQTNNSLPLTKGRITLSDFVEDSLIFSDNNQLQLRYTSRIFELDLDSVFQIPADTAEKIFSVPVLGINIPGGSTLLNQADNFEFTDLDIQLSNAGFKGGQLKLIASNTLESPLIFNYRVPGASRSGTILEIEVEVPAGEIGNPGMTEFGLDLEGYDLDLTGADQSEYNILETNFLLRLAPSEDGAFVTNNDEVSLKAIYSDLEIRYAEGYFGRETAQIESEGISTGLLSQLSGATLILEEAHAEITITNGFGADFSAMINQFEATNSFTGVGTSLTGPLLGTSLNVTRALRSGNNITPQFTAVSLDEDNSNLTQFLTTLPDSLIFGGSVELNPLGNISNFNDFMTESSQLTVDLDLMVPLRFALQGLRLRDTLTFNLSTNQILPLDGILYCTAYNSFPVNASIKLLILTPDNIEIDLNPYLVRGSEWLGDPDTIEILGNETMNMLVFELPESILDILFNSGRIIAEIDFSTVDYPEIITLREDQGIDVFISSQANWNIEIK